MVTNVTCQRVGRGNSPQSRLCKSRRIQTLDPLKCASLFPSCVKAMYVGPYGTKVVPKMFEYVRDLHGLLGEANMYSR